MTDTILPEFILMVLEKEVADVTMQIVGFLCKEYNLPEEEVKKKLGKRICLDLEVDSKKNYRVHRVNVKRMAKNEETQCIALLFDKRFKDTRQCARSRLEGCKFCKTHMKQYNTHTLKYGTIEEKE